MGTLLCNPHFTLILSPSPYSVNFPLMWDLAVNVDLFLVFVFCDKQVLLCSQSCH